MWWPETGSNRRRRPFQGLLSIALKRLESADVIEIEMLMECEIWDREVYFGIFLDLLCTPNVRHGPSVPFGCHPSSSFTNGRICYESVNCRVVETHYRTSTAIRIGRAFVPDWTNGSKDQARPSLPFITEPESKVRLASLPPSLRYSNLNSCSTCSKLTSLYSRSW